ncbi:hypothetical protein Tcan_15656 [Toxocara canis]|uniref:Uncharacterized protein n=1 Tax=Toxocara canis TaxID=6265 RepID=A0A0B2V3J0_TOXCA|nr:hypothetical protein Tcan_15656 [Toxocara canis]
MWFVKVFVGVIVLVMIGGATLIYTPSGRHNCSEKTMIKYWSTLAHEAGGLLQFVFLRGALCFIATEKTAEHHINLDPLQACHRKVRRTVFLATKLYADRECNDMYFIASCYTYPTAYLVMRCPDEKPVFKPGDYGRCQEYVNETLNPVPTTTVVTEPTTLDNGQEKQSIYCTTPVVILTVIVNCFVKVY